MSNPQSSDPATTNGLLASLSAKDRRNVLRYCDSVSLGLGEVLNEPSGKIPYVYFPNSCVICKLVRMADGSSAEAGIIGKEGMVSLYSFLGLQATSVQAVVQHPGEAKRMRVEVFEAEISSEHPLHRLLLRFTAAFLGQVSHSAACNGLHPVQKRCCRWFLMMHDRVERDEFVVTQEFIGKMLGVRRVSITPVARKLQEAGLIRYIRGRITILDRLGLEAASCECYHRTKSIYDGLHEHYSVPSPKKRQPTKPP